MGSLNNDVIKLIQSIVVKNKIRSCCWEYHKISYIKTVNNKEYYVMRGYYDFNSFNYRFNYHKNDLIYKLRKNYPFVAIAKLPKNYV